MNNSAANDAARTPLCIYLYRCKGIHLQDMLMVIEHGKDWYLCLISLADIAKCLLSHRRMLVSQSFTNSHTVLVDLSSIYFYKISYISNYGFGEKI